MSEKSDKKDEVKIKRLTFSNRLKARMGEGFKEQEEGFLSPLSIFEADKIIADLCLDCAGELTKNLDMLHGYWAKMKDLGVSPERTEFSDKMFLCAHEIKDIGSTCGYDLLAHFAESLRDYVGRTELNMHAQVVIIQAHLDAMATVLKAGVKKDAGPEAEELKRMVQKAIEKYH